MARNLVFMQVQGANFAAVREPALSRVVTTDVAEARRAVVTQPVELRNPVLSAERTRLRPELILTGRRAIPRNQVTVAISPVPEPADTVLFEDPANPAKKFYLPRYQLREQGGRYEIAIKASQDGGWRMTLRLERVPAPELGASAQGASPLPHEIAVFFRYGAGPANAIEKRADFTEHAEDAKGVTVAVRLTLLERDSLLHALQTAAAAPQLLVRRAIRVAVKSDDNTAPIKTPPVLVRSRSSVATPVFAPSPLAEGLPKAAPMRALRTDAVVSNLRADRVVLQPINRVVLQRPDRVVLPTPPPPPPPPADLYVIIPRALDNVAQPDPFVLDPRLHPYVYETIGAGVTAAGFRRIPLAHPQGAPDARVHAYFQDRSEPWAFYYLPDSFKLERREIAPFLPQMAVRIDAPDGALENARVAVEFWLEPSTDPRRLKAAVAALKSEIVGEPNREADLRPLQAKAKLQLWVPGAAGAVLSEAKDLVIDLANGFFHSISLPLDDFRQLYAAAYSNTVTSLFTGSVSVDTGLSQEIVPVAVRFAETEGEILVFQEAVANAAINVQVENAIESPVRISSLPVRVRSGSVDVAASIEGVTFAAPIELAPGAKLSFVVRPQASLPGTDPLDAIFDTSGVAILPDPEKILPLISDNSVPAQYERQVDVMTIPELLGELADPTSIILINVEFKGGTSVKLSRDRAEGSAHVRLPLLDLLLGRDVQGRYAFRQQIVRRNGTQTVDSTWREADFSLLVVPVV